MGKLRAHYVVAAAAVFLLATGASVGVGAAASAAPALAAYGPTSGAQLQLSASLVPAGGRLEVCGSGFQPDTAITISINDPSTVLESFETNSSGSFCTTVTIPADTSVGYHVVTVSAATGQSAAATVYVEAAATASSPVSSSGSLPYTGTDAIRTAEVGAAAIGTGGLVVLAARRRRKSVWNN